MSRFRPNGPDWTLDATDPLAVPNATICLALLRCVRALPGVCAKHNHTELGMLLAPLFTRQRERFVAAFRSLRHAPFEETDLGEVDLDSLSVMSDLKVLKFLAGGLVESESALSDAFDAVEDDVEQFLAMHTHHFRENVRLLSELVALPEPERAVLTLAAALCHGTIDRSAFAFVNRGIYFGRVLPRLCGVRGQAVIRMFEAHRPLVASGLFQARELGPHGPDLEDVLTLTLGGECLVTDRFESASDMARVVLAACVVPPAGAAPLQWPHLAEETALLRAMLGSALVTGTAGVNVMIHGAPGSGKTAYVQQLLADIGAEGFSVKCNDSDGREANRAERLASLSLGQAFTGNSARAVLMFDEAEDVFTGDYNNPLARLFKPESGSKAWMNALLESNTRPVIWISNVVAHLDPAYLRRFAFCLEFPRTPFGLRRVLARTLLAPTGCSNEAIDGIAKIESVTPALLSAAARFATATRSSGLGADAAAFAHLNQHLRASGHSGAPAQPEARDGFDMRYLNIAGAFSAESVLAALQSRPAATLQFAGKPGTGKTRFAHEIAARLGRQLIVRTASDINSKWHGESEANVARMFRECDPRSEVLFLDEADVLLGSRDAAGSQVDRAVTAEFLRWLEAFTGIFICATNHPALHDAALARRFVFRLDFRPLTEKQRRSMFEELLSEIDRDAVDRESVQCDLRRLDRLAGLTAGDFANVRRRARSLSLSGKDCLPELECEHAAKLGSTPRIGFL